MNDQANDQADESSNGYSFQISNSREVTVQLGIEPWGFYWPMDAGAEFELVFEDAKDFLSVELVDYAEDHVTFWGAFPSAVYLINPNGTKQEMMQSES